MELADLVFEHLVEELVGLIADPSQLKTSN